MLDKNARNWENIYRESKAGSFLGYPSENLIALFFRHRKLINTEGVGLDFGFGSANNSEFLIAQVRELHGWEVSASSVKIARERLTGHARFQSSRFRVDNGVDAVDGAFDLVVAWQMLYYNDAAGLQLAVDRLRRLLRPGGVLICTMITPRDVKARWASPIARNTYVIDGRIPQQEGCVVYAPASEAEFLELFSRFEVVDRGYFERSSSASGITASEYYLVARK